LAGACKRCACFGCQQNDLQALNIVLSSSSVPAPSFTHRKIFPRRFAGCVMKLGPPVNVSVLQCIGETERYSRFSRVNTQAFQGDKSTKRPRDRRSSPCQS
jgi:hypothetical protein